MIFEVLTFIVDESDVSEWFAVSTGHAVPKRRQLFTNKHIATAFILLSQTCKNSPLEQMGWLTQFVIGNFWRKPGSEKVRHLHQNSGFCNPPLCQSTMPYFETITAVTRIRYVPLS